MNDTETIDIKTTNVSNTEIIFCDRSTLGSHIGMEKSLLETVKKANEKDGMHSIQLFFGSPMMFKRKKIDNDDLKNTTKYLSKNLIQPSDQFTYLSNSDFEYLSKNLL